MALHVGMAWQRDGTEQARVRRLMPFLAPDDTVDFFETRESTRRTREMRV